MVKHLEEPAKRCSCQHWEKERSHYQKTNLWERGAINTEFCFVLQCLHSTWHCGKVRPSLAARDGCAKLWLKRREGLLRTSVLSAQSDVLTGQYFPLHTHFDTLFLFTQTPDLVCYEVSHLFSLQKSSGSTRRTGFVWFKLPLTPEGSRAPQLRPLAVLLPINVKQL